MSVDTEKKLLSRVRQRCRHRSVVFFQMNMNIATVLPLYSIIILQSLQYTSLIFFFCIIHFDGFPHCTA